MKRLSLVLAILLILAIPASVGADLEDDLDEVQKRLSDMATQIKATKGDRTEIAEAILATEGVLDEINTTLSAAETELLGATLDLERGLDTLDVLRRKLDVSYARLEAVSSEIDLNRDTAIALARREYLNGATDTRVFLLDASDVTEVLVRGEYLDRASERNDQLFVRLETLEQQEDRQQELIDEEEARQAELVEKLADTESRLAAVRDRVTERQEAQAAELKRQATLLSEIEDAITHYENARDSLVEDRERIEALIRENNNPSGTTPGVLLRPVPGRITSPFGPRIHPILGTSRLHTGLDMAGARGTNIRAAAGGRVILAGWNGGYGYSVVIVHPGGMTTLYAHQKAVNVSVGQQVKAGDIIGFVGTSGLSTGPHLHFEVRINGTPVDPVPYF